jgi:hypothetical protein
MAIETPQIEQKTGPANSKGLSNAAWGQKLAASRRLRDQFLESWKDSVAFRVQKPFTNLADDTPSSDRVAVPEDWARSKQKAAQLSFQLPKIVATAPSPDLAKDAPLVTAYVNEVLNKQCRAAYMIDECLADVINGAGIMVSKLGVDERYETVLIQQPGPMQPHPLGQVDPQFAGLVVPGPMQMVPVRRLVSRRLFWERVSPAQFLWPIEFAGSDWEQAPWLGVESWLTRAELERRYGQDVAKQASNTPDESDSGSAGASRPNRLADDVMDPLVETNAKLDGVRQTEVWCKAAIYDASVQHPDALRRIVFVDGIDEPVIDELLPWQEWVPAQAAQPGVMNPQTGQPGPGTPATAGYFRGLNGYPIRVAALTYVSDLAVPPSDSQAGRPQVRELIRSRSQMLRQRDSSLPLRWYDANRLDEEVAQAIRMGQWQDIIPTNGDGSRVIGEVARAAYPRENFQFQSVIMTDLDRSWSLSNNQLALANTGRRSATEVQNMQGAAQIRLDYEKGKVNRFVAEGAALLFGLAQLVCDQTDYVTMVGAQGASELAAIVPNSIGGSWAFDFVADSSDRVDPLAKQDKILKVWNLAAQAPEANRPALLAELLQTFGLDPTKLLAPPPPPPPPPPPVLRFSFSGQDMVNPIAVAAMLKSGFQIGPDDIAAASKMIHDAVGQLQGTAPPPAPSAQPAGPGGPAVPPNGGPMEAAPQEPVIAKRSASGAHLV